MTSILKSLPCFMMTPALLVIGATDNTSRGVAEAFSTPLETSQSFSGY
jgi:hypothetical protein